MSSLDGDRSPRRVPVEVRYRDAVAQVFDLFRSELPVVVRDGALRMLADKEVRDALGNDPRLQALSTTATAFALLTAVHKAQRESADPEGLPVRTNVGLAARLGMGVGTAEDAVDALLRLVPEEVAASESEQEDDDLFS